MHTAALARRHLADLLVAVGPDAPTMCEGWTARDLAAHLVIRERRPDALPGIFVPALAGYTERVQNAQAAIDFPELVELVRRKPPIWHPARLAAVDQKMNLMEYAIHAEDIRQANPGADLPPMPEEVRSDAWSALGFFAGMTMSGSPVAVVASCPGRRDVTLVDEGGRRSGRVTATAEPGPMLMFVSGRTDDGVEFRGADDDVARLREARFAM